MPRHYTTLSVRYAASRIPVPFICQQKSPERHHLHDPDLSALGFEQLKTLKDSLMNNPVAQNAGLIVTSPMRRTCQTALGSLDWLIAKGVKIQADAEWQGMSYTQWLVERSVRCHSKSGHGILSLVSENSISRLADQNIFQALKKILVQVRTNPPSLP